MAEPALTGRRGVPIPAPDHMLVDRFRRDIVALAGPEPGTIGIAVSGGADSLALLLLANAAFTGHARALSVDHGLRPAAAEECRYVGEVCARLGVPHETVVVSVDQTGQGLQAAARVARRGAYRLWCERHRLASLLTGHHADDQAETVLMRLARGAGVTGLSGIPQRSGVGGTFDRPVNLLRPLLGWSRAELAAIVGAAGLTPVDDPTNADRRFDRTRFRELLAATDVFETRRLAAVADHCRDADDAVEWIVRDLSERHIVEQGEDRVQLIVCAWPREILRRLVLETFAALGAYPDGPGTMRLIDLLQSGRTATLAGIKVTPGAGTWTFTRAPPRRSH